MAGTDTMCRILLVEDDKEISGMLKSFLTTENFDAASFFPNPSVWFCSIL